MQRRIYDVCIIGAGASGLIAAIESSRRGLSCVVIDKNKKPGMKLYATGSGRCNITNDTWEENSYYENEFVDRVFDCLYRRTGLRQRNFIVDYFESLGLKLVSKDGYFYPASLQASSVVWALLEAASDFGVEFLMQNTVTDVELIDISDHLDSFDIGNGKALEDMQVYKVNHADDEAAGSIFARNIIVATGGLSQKKLGAADRETLEELLDTMRIPFSDFKSGLCPVITNEDMFPIAGVRTRARVSVGKENEIGELQITEEGISGIVVFNLSYYMQVGTDVIINLLPKVTEEEMVQHFNKVKVLYPNKRLDSFLNGYLNDKLAVYMMKKFYGGDLKLTLKDVTETGIRGLYQEMTEWRLGVRSKGRFDSSQATIGGIVTNIIDPYSMHIADDRSLGSRIFATGEVTDVIGRCGGYNLTYAFVTGYLAGISVY